MSGAFQTSREIFENPIWKNIVDFRLFFLIYGNAVFAEEGYRMTEDLHLQRGEWCRSIRKLREDLTFVENRQVKMYSVSVISRCIARLVQSQRVCTRLHELGTVFTVLNYEQYQGFEGYKKKNLEQDLEQSGNSEGTVGEQSGNNNKNVKKEKNDKKVNKEIIYTPEFESFWESYPKQVGKPAAFNNFKKLLKNHTFEYLIACGINYRSYCIANSTDDQYIKMPNNFLNAKEEYFKQFETPVLIHNKGGPPKGKQSSTGTLQELYRQAEEAERNEANGSY